MIDRTVYIKHSIPRDVTGHTDVTSSVWRHRLRRPITCFLWPTGQAGTCQWHYGRTNLFLSRLDIQQLFTRQASPHCMWTWAYLWYDKIFFRL